MRKTALLFIVVVFFSACSARKNTISSSRARQNNRSIQRENGMGSGPQITSLQYIDRYKTIAIQEMKLYGIPASITLAQGLFESGSGNGELARVANNHFGIKCTSDWQGKSYYKDDDHVNDCFRVYDKAEDSFRDHSKFLQRKNYAKLFELDRNDYQGWAYGLKRAGYATNPNYPTLLINIIQKYNLHQYDSPEGEIQKIKRVDTVFTRIDKNIYKAAKDSTVKAKKDSTLYAPVIPAPAPTPISKDTTSAPAPGNKLYTVVKGDTLFNISKRFGLTVDDLKALNNLDGNNIKLGQKLVVVKQVN